MSLTILLKQIDKWLFEPTSPTPIALVRILIGLIVLQNLVVHLLPDFDLYFGDHPLITFASSSTKYWGTSYFFDAMVLLPPGEQWRFAFFICVILAAICMTLGLFSRVSMTAVFLGLLSLDNHFELNQNDGDVFLRLACMILAFSNAGDAFSLDNLIRGSKEDWRVTGFKPRLSAPWAQRWFQMQLAFVYCHTFFAKISGKHWVDGWAVYFASRYDDCQRFMLPVVYDNPYTIKLLTWGTLVIEFALWTFVWFKEFRYWILLGGLMLHFGIECTMNLPMFEWLFMSSYCAFIYPEDLSKFMDLIKVQVHKFFGEPVLLAFNGSSISSVRLVGVLHRMDIFGFLKLADTNSDEFPPNLISFCGLKSGFAICTQNAWLNGFDAWRWVSLRLPLLWPFLGFFYLPPLSGLAKFAYNALSTKKMRLFGSERLVSANQ